MTYLFCPSLSDNIPISPKKSPEPSSFKTFPVSLKTRIETSLEKFESILFYKEELLVFERFLYWRTVHFKRVIRMRYSTLKIRLCTLTHLARVPDHFNPSVSYEVHFSSDFSMSYD